VYRQSFGALLAMWGSTMRKKMNPFNDRQNCNIEAFIIMLILLVFIFGCVG
jgi:hypothetical protein